ncbi:MAG: hypothetical protein ACYDCQ_04200 [Dehalococcoidia bacterium]
MNESGAPDPAYIRARRGLLDALDALGPHRRAVILVGAQAVYLNVGEAREALSSSTIDADLALNPAAMPDNPALLRYGKPVSVVSHEPFSSTCSEACCLAKHIDQRVICGFRLELLVEYHCPRFRMADIR